MPEALMIFTTRGPVSVMVPSIMKKSSAGIPGRGGKVDGSMLQAVPCMDWWNKLPVFAPVPLKKYVVTWQSASVPPRPSAALPPNSHHPQNPDLVWVVGSLKLPENPTCH